MSVVESETTTFTAPRSRQLAAGLSRLIPGGVDSPFRSFKEVGGHTIFMKSARGARLYDEDGNEFIDYLGAWGPAILGHAVPEVVAACREALELGAVFGTPCALELELAELVMEAVPGLEMVRFVNSGTEAVMSAIRLARGYTGRDLIVMFEGCYHGHSESVLASRDHSSSAGIPVGISSNTALVPFNNIAALARCLDEHKRRIAAVVIEPVAGSMGVVAPEPGYLQAVERLCAESGAVLIFDEVLTGFRVARGGAAELFDAHPHLYCFGKALAGGMPIGAFGGRKEIMNCLEPIGKVYQAGTFSGNPVTMAGGIATLKLLRERSIYDRLEELTARLFSGIRSELEARSLPVQLQRVGSMFSIIFSEKPVKNFQDSKSIDAAAFARFYHKLLHRGLYLPPSSVDAAAVSAAHTVEDIDISAVIIAESIAESLR